MSHLLSVHHEPSLPREKLEARWRRLAQERRAFWIKSWCNMDLGKRYCWWGAPSKEALEEVFHDHGVPWEEIVEVKFTTPAEWIWRED